ncbi:MAG: phenylalanine--tRNA ligase subunit beta [Candidatus Dormibacteria bacterium]
MRVSHEWLTSMVDLSGVSPREVAHLLTVTGTEVEKITEFAQGLEGVVVGEVVGLKRVERSDHLFLAEVRAGGDEPLEVVCGAPNLFVGALVPWARPGTKLPSGVEIGRRRIRGVESHGMLCAPDELGLGPDHAGIMVLAPGDAAVGQPLSVAFPHDVVYELEILSNRADCLSHWGVARELAACLRRPLQDPDISPVIREGQPLAERVAVEIEDSGLCPVYWAEGFLGIPQGPTPLWIRRRLLAVGQRSVGAVVDLGNYVMLEIGQPLHTFDLDRIRDQVGSTALSVRFGFDGERMLGLDGAERSLDPETLVIAANGRASAIAGVMGAMESAVTAATTNLLLESASFAWTSIRGTSRRLGVRTEASSRFERPLSPHLVPVGAARFTRLLRETLGVAPLPGPCVAGALPPAPPAIRISADRISALLGMRVDEAKAGEILKSLEFLVDRGAEELLVTPPAVRTDVSLPIDIVEEVGRIVGYAAIASTLPPLRQPPPHVVGASPLRLAAEVAMGAGFNECVTLSLVDSGRQAPVTGLAGMGGNRPALQIGNPLSTALGALRTGILPGLLGACQLNQSRGRARIRLFEQGRAFWATSENDRPLEPDLIGFVDQSVDGDADDSALRLRHLLAVCQALGDRLSAQNTTFRMGECPGFHPTRCALVVSGGVVRGVVGELDQRSTAALQLRGRVVAAELRTDHWLVPGGRPSTTVDLARTPQLVMDLAVKVPVRAELGFALEAVKGANVSELEEIRVLDEYRGPQLGNDLKGWTFRLVFRDPIKTLTNSRGEALRDRVAEALHASAGAVVR